MKPFRAQVWPRRRSASAWHWGASSSTAVVSHSCGRRRLPTACSQLDARPSASMHCPVVGDARAERVGHQQAAGDQGAQQRVVAVARIGRGAGGVEQRLHAQVDAGGGAAGGSPRRSRLSRGHVLDAPGVDVQPTARAQLGDRGGGRRGGAVAVSLPVDPQVTDEAFALARRPAAPDRLSHRAQVGEQVAPVAAAGRLVPSGRAQRVQGPARRGWPVGVRRRVRLRADGPGRGGPAATGHGARAGGQVLRWPAPASPRARSSADRPVPKTSTAESCAIAGPGAVQGSWT